jgi:nitrite reductase/ring-hydroxylating ferredoxin subunit
MAIMPSSLRLCSVNDVPWHSAIRVECGDLVLAVYNVNGQIYVTDDQCTHGPGSLSEGYLDGYQIECGFHSGRFDVRTGEVAGPPCMIPVKTYKVSIVGEDVMIKL